MRAYYFTNEVYAVSDIALRRIKVSRFEDLNDPFELIGADLRNKEDRAAFKEMKHRLHEKYGVLCFSKDWSNPLLWSHYSDKHRGLCLGFDIEDSEAQDVEYVEKPLKMRFTSQLARHLLLIKYLAWKYEEEVRVIINLEKISPEGGLHFVPFSLGMELREVILGPRCALPFKKVLQLCKQISNEIEVRRARLAFSSFRVIESRLRLRPTK